MVLVNCETIDSVKGWDGCVRLNKILLSDGCTVYDICFHGEQDQVVFTLSPATKQTALAMFEDIKNSV